jgi:large subunit ribosomal protein L30
MAQLRITQLISEVRSSIKQKRTLEALGLRGIRKSVTREKNASLDGMVRVIAHLVKVEEVK